MEIILHPLGLTLTMASPVAGWRVSRVLVAIVVVSVVVVSVVVGVVVARAEGGICRRRGSGVGSGAAGVAAHASDGVLPSSA